MTATLIERLMAIDPQYASVQALSANVREGLLHNLRDAGQFAEAIALQKDVVALRRERLTPERTSRILGNIAFSLAIVGIIPRDARDRTLACASYGESGELISEIAAHGEILGFQENLFVGLAEEGVCANGGSIEGPLRP